MLGPGERGVAGQRPASSVMVVGVPPAQVVDPLQDVFELFGHLVEVVHFVEKADHTAFGARAVVAQDVDEQCVVHLAHPLDRVTRRPTSWSVCSPNPAKTSIWRRTASSRQL